MRDFVSINKIKRTFRALSILSLILVSSIACAFCFDVGVSPGSICCGDWVTVTISLTNTGESVFSGRVEIYIIDANGNQDRMDGLSITLQPHESRTFQTRIRPKDCKSYGTYQVVVKLVDDNGREQGTRKSSFVVKDPASCQSPSGGSKPSGCTWTFTCDNNVVKRLCVDQNGKEYWKEYDNCNNYNPKRECINGVCVDTTTPGGPDQPKQTCNQQACQSQNRPIGTPYTKNGMQYQKYMECSCVNNQCKCEEIEKPGKKPSSCDNCMSGPVGDPYLKDGMAYQKYQECTCVDGKCNCKSVEKEVPCTGIVSGHVYYAKTWTPIKNATLQISQNKYLLTNPTDDSGYFTVGGSCPSALTTLTCSADGYISDTKIGIADAKGNLEQNFELMKEKMNFKLISPDPKSKIDLSDQDEIYIKVKSDNTKGGTIKAKLIFNPKYGDISRSEDMILDDSNYDGIYEYKIDLKALKDKLIDSFRTSLKMKDKIGMCTAIHDYVFSATGTYKLTLVEYNKPTNAITTGQFYAKSGTTGISIIDLYIWNWDISSLGRALSDPEGSLWTGDWRSIVELDGNLDKLILFLSEDNEGTAYIDLASTTVGLIPGAPLAFAPIKLYYAFMVTDWLKKHGHDKEANEIFDDTLKDVVLSVAANFNEGAEAVSKIVDLKKVSDDIRTIFGS